IGVLLSGAGMFLVVFGLQEGQSQDWAPWIWGTIACGIGLTAAFVFWQSMNRQEPLIPLRIFRDQDFSLSNAGIAVMGFVAVALIVPLMFYLQAVCGLSPTRSALLSAPMAITTGVLAPFVGKIVDRAQPRPVIGFGFSALAIALTWLSAEMTPTTPIWRLVLPLAAIGVGMAFIWAPLAATATRNLPPELAGAGSGVYNAIRQVGSVLGSASMAAFMTWRLSAELPPMPDGVIGTSEGSVTRLPGFLHQPFANAMSQSLLLPAFVALFGIVAAVFLIGVRPGGESGVGDDQPTDPIPAVGEEQRYAGDDSEPDSFVDDDEYSEYTVTAGELHFHDHEDDHEDDTERFATHIATAGRLATKPQRPSTTEPIGFAHNGFHVDHEQRFRDPHDLARREQQPPQRRAKHYRDDPEPYGRHAMPSHD
ncbi:MAG: MFS transporter, partial [Mycobacteriaceae bacterium]|nr:MFS transporter [Mycobacteriaceae bacterium]